MDEGGDIQDLTVGVNVDRVVAGDAEDTRESVKVLVKGKLEDRRAALTIENVSQQNLK